MPNRDGTGPNGMVGAGKGRCQGKGNGNGQGAKRRARDGSCGGRKGQVGNPQENQGETKLIIESPTN